MVQLVVAMQGIGGAGCCEVVCGNARNWGAGGGEVGCGNARVWGQAVLHLVVIMHGIGRQAVVQL